MILSSSQLLLPLVSVYLASSCNSNTASAFLIPSPQTRTPQFRTPSPSLKVLLADGNDEHDENKNDGDDTDDISTDNNTKMIYGERSRRFRRTIYTAEDWIQHRDPNRFFRNLVSIFRSGVANQVYKEVFFVTVAAAFVDIWNGLFLTGYSDFSGGQHEPLYQFPNYLLLELPIEPFQLSSTVLGLLLVFRTNTSYSRWNEARSLWGMIINHSRNIMRMATSWTLPEPPITTTTHDPQNPTTITTEQQQQHERKEALDNLSLTVWQNARCLQTHLWPPSEDELPFRTEIRARLDPERAAACIDAKHRPTVGLYDLANAVERLGPLMSFVRRVEIDRSVVKLGEMGGKCEQIYDSPVPLVYTRFTARILSLWLLLLPLGLYASFGNSWNHVLMIPCSTITAFFYFGIEELAVQLEEPFSILPIDGFSDGIYARAKEYVQYHDNAFKMGVKKEGEKRLKGGRSKEFSL